jgi:hypothetical protein
MFQQKINSDYVINPKTSRPVKIGSIVYTRLVKEGILKNTVKNEKELYEYNDGEDIESIKKEINKKLPASQVAVKGQGKYKNKIVVRNKQIPLHNVLAVSKKATASILQDEDNMKILANTDEEEWENEINRMILEELHHPTKKPMKMKETKKQVKYQAQEEEDDDDFYEN